MKKFLYILGSFLVGMLAIAGITFVVDYSTDNKISNWFEKITCKHEYVDGVCTECGKVEDNKNEENVDQNLLTLLSSYNNDELGYSYGQRLNKGDILEINFLTLMSEKDTPDNGAELFAVFVLNENGWEYRSVFHDINDDGAFKIHFDDESLKFDIDNETLTEENAVQQIVLGEDLGADIFTEDSCIFIYEIYGCDNNLFPNLNTELARKSFRIIPGDSIVDTSTDSETTTDTTTGTTTE